MLKNIGYDPALVIHEEFFQWVITEVFSARPKFELAGIQLVSNVEPHENEIALSKWNHSALACLGYLAAIITAECVSDDIMVNYIQYLWEKEIIPTLETPQGENLNDYCSKLLERYHNPAIEHRTGDCDGWKPKLPQRILETVYDLLKHKRNFQGLALAIVAWIKYVSGRDLNKTIDVRDPLVNNFAMIAKKSKTSEQYVGSILDQTKIFSKYLRDSVAFRKEVQKSYKILEQCGSLGSIKKFMSSVKK